MNRLTLSLGAVLLAWCLLQSSAMAQERLLTPEAKQIADLQVQVRTLEQRLTQTQQQVAALLQVIRISGADVEITAGNNLKMNAGRDMQINPAHSFTVNTPMLNLRSASSRIESTGSSTIQAAGTMVIRAARLGLNGASKPLATVGSNVAVGGNSGQVISGSANIFAE
jgi:hypothetical protein